VSVWPAAEGCVCGGGCVVAVRVVGGMSAGGAAGSTTQLWKTNDQKAQKAGSHATVFWTNQNTYAGEWRDNKKDGRGTFTCKDKKLKYEGDFVSGKRQGHGVLWKDEGKGRLRRVYEGDWEHDKRHGAGTMYYSNGDVYTGGFHMSKKAGMGKMVYGNNDYYEGEYADDRRDGYGVLILANGDRYEGNWAADMKEGPGVYYYMTKRQIYKGEWREDVAKCGEMMAMEDEPQAEQQHWQMPEIELTDPDMVLGSRVNTLRIERAAKQIRGTTVSPDSFTQAQLTSLRKGFAIVNSSGDGAIPAFQLADVFAQFGAELGQEECLALLSAIDCTDETSLLTFDQFLVCMAVLVNA
jgi:hypothetical protein